MWSISCNIHYHAQQQGQHMIQWSMLPKRTFLHSRRANTANRQSIPHVDVIKRKKARAALWQKGFEHLEHCAACDLKWSLRRGKDRKDTFSSMKRKRNGSRILWRERPLWQETEFKTQRQRLCEIWRLLKTNARQLEIPKQCLKTC